MKPEIKAKWVEALRSGKYQQGTGQLRSANNEFCCLGVLCDLAEKEGIVTAAPEYGDPSDDWEYDFETGSLPPSVRTWAGLDRADPELGEESAIRYNDDLDKDFRQIADLVEKYL